MNNVKKIVFVAGSGTTRAPLAMAIFNNTQKKVDIIAEARGLVVNFPEPLNQKAEAVMISNGLELKDYSTVKLSEEDFSEDTMIIVMEKVQRQRILADFENATEENTKVLNELVGDELEVVDPYGGPIQTYGLCYEVLKVSIEKLIRIFEA